ncbi:Clr5 domain-containing protein [Geopyxis carbonaria]|nr:Clr5 domain-containing protein [Geopyxis carbonaria]
MPRKPNTPATIWESYKEELRQLYVAQDKGLSSVMEHMESTYGLEASKNEYQRIFKQWDFRKNLTQKEWAFVNHRTRKRKAEDATKETEVTFQGVRQDPKRVKKELNRYFPWSEQQPTDVSSPKTPAGILVGTPADLIGTPPELIDTATELIHTVLEKVRPIFEPNDIPIELICRVRKPIRAMLERSGTPAEFIVTAKYAGITPGPAFRAKHFCLQSGGKKYLSTDLLSLLLNIKLIYSLSSVSFGTCVFIYTNCPIITSAYARLMNSHKLNSWS